MGILDGIKRQLRSVIQWEDPNPDDLFYRWTDNGDEIKNASKLIVNPGQGCIFVYQGKIEAVLDTEGMIDLKTANIPFWTTISKFMQSFVSEHKVGIYFYKKTMILDQKWGTTSPIKYQDPKYNFPVALKAYGNYTFRVSSPKALFTDIVGGVDTFSIADFRKVMSSRLVQPLTDFIAEQKYSYADVDANREEIAKGVKEKLMAEFGSLGFEINDFKVEGTNFDEDTMKRINRIADMQAEAQAAAAVGLNYADVQKLDALKTAAGNEGGIAGLGVGVGAGLGLGQMMGATMGQGMQGGGAAPAADDPMAKLQKLKAMLDGGLISAEEFEVKKKEILSKM